MLRSAYHNLLDTPWYEVGVFVLLAYTLSHLFFGTLYYLCNGVQGVLGGGGEGLTNTSRGFKC